MMCTTDIILNELEQQLKSFKTHDGFYQTHKNYNVEYEETGEIGQWKKTIEEEIELWVYEKLKPKYKDISFQIKLIDEYTLMIELKCIDDIIIMGLPLLPKEKRS